MDFTMCFPLRVALLKICFCLHATCFPFSSLCCVCSIVLWSLTRIQSGSGGAVNNFTHSLYSPLVWNMLVLKWLCSIFRRTAHLGTFDNSMRVELNSGLQHVATQTYPRCGATTELPICETSINFLPNHSAIGIAWYSTSGTVTVSNNVRRLKDLWGFSANWSSLQSQRSLKCSRAACGWGNLVWSFVCLSATPPASLRQNGLYSSVSPFNWRIDKPPPLAEG